MATIVLPTYGLIDIATIAIADIFNANSNKKYEQIAFFYIVGWSLGLMAGPLFVFPILKRFFDNFWIFVITLCICLFAMLIFAFICLQFDSPWIVSIASCILGIGFLCYSALNAIVTKYTNKNQRGRVFGALYAVQSMVNCVAPISFGQIFHCLKRIGYPSLIFVVCFVVLSFALLLCIGLKNAINSTKADEKKKQMIN